MAFLPLTFVAGVEGFGLFVCYLAFICLVLEVRRVSRRMTLVPVRVNEQRFVPEVDLESATA